MLSASQLAEVEQRMEEEHRKDREALIRLKRFLNTDGHSGPVIAPMEEEDEHGSPYPDSIIGKVTILLQTDPLRKWTVPEIVTQLRSERFPLTAKKPESTIGLTLRKLHKRGLIKIVRKSSGHNPSVYRWKTEAKEATSQQGSEGERAAVGQPVHVH